MSSSTLTLSLAARVVGVEYPPLSPAPSARDFSRSMLAPPVTHCRNRRSAAQQKKCQL
jgi:hypothetical protein